MTNAPDPGIFTKERWQLLAVSRDTSYALSPTYQEFVLRAILRFSLDRDDKSAIRNHLHGKLGAAGFQNSKTGTWEATGPASQILPALRDALLVLENPSAAVSGATAVVDHVWFYLD